ncbi:E3 ubiquitin-protein ligase RNF128a [Denticeps clupeoides]|uniref:RING-type domain-containing protein n=1 Tax=Denticeps clupeoides TaxID=299321 RepID=A0AAY4AXE8_9TELE|nr:E3 ubiquitin-protein ligase RNF128 [Denticeps clupeoides]
MERLLPWTLLVFSLQVSSLRPAQATYICTAYINVSFVAPQNNETMWRFEEIGLYGQDSPKAAAAGDVYVPDPLFSCGDETSYPVPDGAKGWVALIQRGGGCTFSEKINIASRSGAAAAVIFNDVGTDNRVIPMSHPGTGDTVAVMIGHIRGMEILRLLQNGVAVTMAIEVGKQHGPWMSHYSVFFVSISFFLVTAATVGYFIFYSARRLNSVRLQNRKQKQLKAEAKKAIGQLQVRTLKQGDQETQSDADTCAVCIEAYKPGDVLSILTCNHFFHKQCIEPWLLEHRTCPMCKCDILKALGVEPDIKDIPHEVPMTPEMQSLPSVIEDSQSDSASSGYESIHGAEESLSNPVSSAPPVDLDTVQVDIQRQYDNLGFECEVQDHRDPRT